MRFAMQIGIITNMTLCGCVTAPYSITDDKTHLQKRANN